MFELAGALLIGMLTWLGIVRVLARGTFLSRQRTPPAERERMTKTRPFEQHQRRTGGQKEAERRPQAQTEPSRRQTEQERRSQRQRQRQRAQAATHSEENEWWSILEVSPDAGADEIRRSYLGKIQQSHPDRLVGLTPELLALFDGAEERT